MFGVAADQRTGQRHDLLASRSQGTCGMALSCVGTLLFVDLIQDQVLEEGPQPTLDVESRLVAPEIAIHLPQRRAAAFHELVAELLARVALTVAVRQHPLALGASFPQAGA